MRFDNKLWSATAFLLLVASSVQAGYAPVRTACPRTDLVRPADGLSHDEWQYRHHRKVMADKALKKWLEKTHCGFQAHGRLPTVSVKLYR